MSSGGGACGGDHMDHEGSFAVWLDDDDSASGEGGERTLYILDCTGTSHKYNGGDMA